MTEERRRLIQWLEKPRKQICPKCYAKFKALTDFDSDIFDVLCPRCNMTF
jgi:predicted  nucleic acid-binding Zn ribbon protein